MANMKRKKGGEGHFQWRFEEERDTIWNEKCKKRKLNTERNA